jgi:hypothetical protein
LKRARVLATLAAALALSVGLSCQLFVDLDGLGNGQCPSGKKPCNGTCVPNSSTTYGCGSSDCAPCVLTNVADFICDRNNACAPSQCVLNYKTCPYDNGDCMTDVAHSADNCGSCGVHCSDPMNGIAGCADGVCAIKSCNPPYDDCDHDPGNGCETNLSIDQANCGECGHGCPTGRSCVSGHCALTDASAD